MVFVDGQAPWLSRAPQTEWIRFQFVRGGGKVLQTFRTPQQFYFLQIRVDHPEFAKLFVLLYIIINKKDYLSAMTHLLVGDL